MSGSARLLPSEVTVHGENAEVVEWALSIGNPWDSPLHPVMLFMTSDIHEALRDGRKVWANNGEMQVTRDGYAHCVVYGHGEAVDELFPARFDERPYEPLVYVGRWPD